MTRPPLPSSGSKLRFKSSHRRVCLKTSHRRIGIGEGGVERAEPRERYIGPPPKYRR